MASLVLDLVSLSLSAFAPQGTVLFAPGIVDTDEDAEFMHSVGLSPRDWTRREDDETEDGEEIEQNSAAAAAVVGGVGAGAFLFQGLRLA